MASESEQSIESSPASVSSEKSKQEILVETANEYADVFTVDPQKEVRNVQSVLWFWEMTFLWEVQVAEFGSIISRPYT